MQGILAMLALTRLWQSMVGIWTGFQIAILAGVAGMLSVFAVLMPGDFLTLGLQLAVLFFIAKKTLRRA